MRVAGLAYGGVDLTLQWGRKEQAVDFFDVKGDVEALLAPLSAVFEPAEHPAMHPGRCARVCLGERVHRPCGRAASPAGARPGELPQAPVLFELELDAVLQRPVPGFAPYPSTRWWSATWLWW